MMGLGNLWFTQVSPDGSYAVDLLPGFFAIGIGLGFSFVPVSIAALAGVTRHEAGLASGLFNTSQQIGGALGVAVLSTVATRRSGELVQPRRRSRSGFSTAFWVAVGFAIAALVATLTMIHRGGDRGRAGRGGRARPEPSRIGHQVAASAPRRYLDPWMRPPTCLWTGTDAVSAAAASIGATDLFVFRRITADRFVHVGGLGRGEGWAGNIDLILAAEDLAREAMTTGAPVFARAAEPAHVFGPYYQREAVFVPLSPDVIVVFGVAEPGALSVDGTAITTAAEAAAAAIEQVSTAKRLADELELLHAVHSLARTDAVRIRDVMRHVVGSAIEALSCDLGVIYVAELDVTETVAAEPDREPEAASSSRRCGRSTRRRPGYPPASRTRRSSPRRTRSAPAA